MSSICERPFDKGRWLLISDTSGSVVVVLEVKVGYMVDSVVRSKRSLSSSKSLSCKHWLLARFFTCW